MTYDYVVTAFRVVDGDTWRLTIDMGCRIFSVIECRLNGWDCPEKRSTATRKVEQYEKEAALKATAEADRWLANALATGSLRVTTEKDPEKYGRWISNPYFGPHAQTLGQFLARQRLAVPYYGTKAQPRWYEVYLGPVAS